MSDTAERWDVYDVDRNLTGRTRLRSEEPDGDDYHLIVHICIFNSRGEMLVQHRLPTKEMWPGLWDLSAGGNSVTGDTSRSAAQRELEEELGIVRDFSHLRPYMSINFPNGLMTSIFSTRTLTSLL